MGGTVREARDQPRVDGADCQCAPLRSRPKVRIRLEKPRDLGPGEVWIEDETRTTANLVLMASILERSAERLRSTILPHDRSVYRLQRLAIPEDDGLALVGESHRSDLGTGCGLECLSSYSTRHVPNLGRPRAARERSVRKVQAEVVLRASAADTEPAATVQRVHRADERVHVRHDAAARLAGADPGTVLCDSLGHLEDRTDLQRAIGRGRAADLQHHTGEQRAPAAAHHTEERPGTESASRADEPGSYGVRHPTSDLSEHTVNADLVPSKSAPLDGFRIFVR